MNRSRFALLSLAVAAALTCGLVSAQTPAPVVPVPPAAAPPGFYPAAPGAGGGFGGGFFTQTGPSGHNEASQLASQYVHAEKNSEKKDLRKKLDDVLSKQFDQHMEHQKKELDDLEKQIEQLKATLKKRQDAKETIVSRRAEQLINEAEGLGWTAPSGPRGGSSSSFGGRGGFGRSSSFTPPPSPDALPRPSVSSASVKLEVK